MKYIVDIKVDEKNDASVKPRTDIDDFLSYYDWKRFNIINHQKKRILKNMDMIFNLIKLMLLKKEDVVIVQWKINLLKPFSKLEFEKLLKCKKILFIHDIESLRLQQKVNNEIRKFNYYDVVIVHTEKMKKWLKKNGLHKPIVVHEVFDYKLDTKINRKCEDIKKFKVVFAGSLDKNKSGFLYSNLYPKNYSLELYGNNYIEQKDVNIRYNGTFLPNEVVHKLKGDFGLVWDGESIKTCAGNYGEYLRYNCPYKCAMYLAAQIPVIIWSQAAMADFVKREKIGILIDSLDEIDHKLSNLTKEQYRELLENVSRIQEEIINGENIRKSVCRAEELLEK